MTKWIAPDAIHHNVMWHKGKKKRIFFFPRGKEKPED